MNENENEGEIFLRMPMSMAVSLTAILGAQMSSEVLGDLGLDELYSQLVEKVGHFYLENAVGLIRREHRDVAASATRFIPPPIFLST